MSEDAPGPMTATASRLRAFFGDALAALVVLSGGGLLGIFGAPAGPPLYGGGASPPGMPGQPGMAQMADIALTTQLTFVGLFAFAAGLMFLRRTLPALVFGLSAVLFSLAVVFGLPAMGPGIALVIASYAFASRVRRRPVFFATSGVVVVLLLLGFAASDWQTVEPRVLQIAAATAIAAALGDSARSRREYLAAVEERAKKAEQEREAEASRRVSEERLRIARDLHDTVAHQISVINLHAGVATSHLRERPERAEQALATIREAAREALGEIGELLHYLRDNEHEPGISERAALPPQLGLDALTTLLERVGEAGLQVRANIGDGLENVPLGVATVAYRVVQEGLTNAQKHGSGTVILDVVAMDAGRHEQAAGRAIPELRIRMSNPIAGPASQAGSGFGLVGIRERVAVLRGTVETGREGEDYVLTVTLPLPSKVQETE